jgi:hypothetical protein
LANFIFKISKLHLHTLGKKIPKIPTFKKNIVVVIGRSHNFYFSHGMSVGYSNPKKLHNLLEFFGQHINSQTA